MRNNLFTKILYTLLYLTAIADAQQNNSVQPGLFPLGNFGNNIVNSFKGNNIYYHLGGAAATAILVTSGADYYVNKYFNEHEEYGNATVPVVRAAMYFPIVIFGSLFAYGKLHKDYEAVGASYAVLQSSIIAFGYNTILKGLTGRPGPDWRHNDDMEDLSKTFRFGFLRGGVFWGWPSGHTSSTMTIVSALTSFYPHKTWLKAMGYSYVAYMVLGVSSVNRGGMHWFSDAVAASLMSYAIGSTVGKYYRSRFGQYNTTTNYLNFAISL